MPVAKKARLPLPNPCPHEGVWLASQQFFYQPPKVFSHLGNWADIDLKSDSKRSPLDVLESFSSREAFDAQSFFANSHPICVEFCSGNGAWIEQKALHSPQCNWIAVERRLDRAQKIWHRKIRSELSNLAIACAEAALFCAMFLPTHGVQQCFVNFPDPWPKARHAKHRLLKPTFLSDLERALVAGGHLLVASDDAQLMEQLESDLRSGAHFHLNRHLVHSGDWGYGTSFFAELWRSKGRKLHLAHCRAPLPSVHLQRSVPLLCETQKSM